MDEASREMTLDEYVGQLQPQHAAQIELDQLRQQLAVWETSLGNLQEHAVGLAEQLAAALADAARLDWLAHYGASLRHDQSDMSTLKGWFVVVPFYTGIPSVDDRKRFDTARDAIDAVLAQDAEAAQGGGNG